MDIHIFSLKKRGEKPLQVQRRDGTCPRSHSSSVPKPCSKPRSFGHSRHSDPWCISQGSEGRREESGVKVKDPTQREAFLVWAVLLMRSWAPGLGRSASGVSLPALLASQGPGEEGACESALRGNTGQAVLPASCVLTPDSVSQIPTVPFLSGA